MQSWTCKEVERDLHSFDVDLREQPDGEFKVLVTSDEHIDSIYHCGKQFHKDMDAALDINAPVFSNGDFFDAMQGRYDGRKGKANELLPELVHSDKPYLQAMVEYGVEKMLPYRDILSVRAVGNHERAIEKHCEWNIAQEFVTRMRAAGAQNIHLGGYGGWLGFTFKLTETTRIDKLMKYHHGAGGGGVHKGGQKAARDAERFMADIYCSGHTHTEWSFPRSRRIVIHPRGGLRKVKRTEWHFRVPGYKDEFEGDYVQEKDLAPEPNAGAWITFRKAGNGVEFKIERTAWA